MGKGRGVPAQSKGCTQLVDLQPLLSRWAPTLGQSDAPTVSRQAEGCQRTGSQSNISRRLVLLCRLEAVPDTPAAPLPRPRRPRPDRARRHRIRIRHGAGTPQHGLYPNKTALITSDCGI